MRIAGWPGLASGPAGQGRQTPPSRCSGCLQMWAYAFVPLGFFAIGRGPPSRHSPARQRSCLDGRWHRVDDGLVDDPGEPRPCRTTHQGDGRQNLTALYVRADRFGAGPNFIPGLWLGEDLASGISPPAPGSLAFGGFCGGLFSGAGAAETGQEGARRRQGWRRGERMGGIRRRPMACLLESRTRSRSGRRSGRS